MIVTAETDSQTRVPSEQRFASDSAGVAKVRRGASESNLKAKAPEPSATYDWYELTDDHGKECWFRTGIPVFARLLATSGATDL